MSSEGENRSGALMTAVSSKETFQNEFRVAVKDLLEFLKKRGIGNDFELPCRCKIYPGGIFTREVDISVVGGTRSVRILNITIGQPIDENDLLEFRRLIEDGFIEELIAELNKQKDRFIEAKVKISLL